MATKAKATIDEQIEAMPASDHYRQSRLKFALLVCRHEMGPAELLTNAETIALAKKLLCRGLRTELTRAQVEAFLRG